MENTIVTMTDAAFNHIQKQLAHNPDKKHFRLGVKRTGCSGWMYTPELIAIENSGDECVLEKDNLKVYINPEHFPILRGTVIDFVDHGMGAKEMQFKNPNAANLCGCGESFNLLEESDD